MKMKPGRCRSGPLVWLATLAVRCLLLFLFQKIFWLVVGFLLTRIGYYLLLLILQRQILGRIPEHATLKRLAFCGRDTGLGRN